jgi:hypothetical protein
LKSGSLKLLEPPGPVQAFNGISLPFISLIIMSIVTVVTLDNAG